MNANRSTQYLPMSLEEMRARGQRECDILLVTADAYFDHPTHGIALLGRVLESEGYRVGIIAQPNWRSTDDFKKLGRPTLFAGISAGAVDSTINNYTAELARRRTDAYSPGGQGGGRPDFATLVYANRVREAFPGLPIVLGGIEASTRRFAYFDAIKKKLRRSVLVDSRADLLVLGPGRATGASDCRSDWNRGEPGGHCRNRQIGARKPANGPDAIPLPDFETLRGEPSAFVEQAVAVERTAGPGCRSQVYQRYPEGTVLAEPRQALSTSDLDRFYSLPFTRNPHPSYTQPIPALETVRWSVTSHNGCPGGCSFCALASHQGRQVVPRSADSILEEIRRISAHPDFRGTITDIGGPTANAYTAQSTEPAQCLRCRRLSCLHPSICKHIDTDHGPLLALLGEAMGLEGIKHVFLASGIRHDLAMRDPAFIAHLAKYHTGGHLKVAPEHVDPSVLKRMRKPSISLFEEFENLFRKGSRAAGKEQYIVPYFIAAFPGCNPQQANGIGRWLAKRNQRLRQVQTFIPLPGTAAAAMHACGRDEKGRPLFIADDPERRRQKSMLTEPAKSRSRSNQR